MMPLNQVIAINDVNSNYDGLAEAWNAWKSTGCRGSPSFLYKVIVKQSSIIGCQILAIHLQTLLRLR